MTYRLMIYQICDRYQFTIFHLYSVKSVHGKRGEEEIAREKQTVYELLKAKEKECCNSLRCTQNDCQIAKKQTLSRKESTSFLNALLIYLPQTFNGEILTLW